MKLLQNAIQRDGYAVNEEVLKVDKFLNHMVDPELMEQIGNEFARRFKGEKITKVLTIESSGIAPAVFTALALGVPMIYAKKTGAQNLDEEVYETSVHSFTKQKDYIIKVSKKYLDSSDVVLLVDDFLANGQALIGLAEICAMADAKLAGAGVVIEKGFQDGGNLVRNMGIRVESLAIIDKMTKEQIWFRNEEEN